MKIPNHKNAKIDRKKITDYLLSHTHSMGQDKARFFNLHGYSSGNIDQLIEDLLSLVNNDVLNTIQNSFGTKYIIEGKIKAPAGRTIILRSIWFIDNNDTIPRFITAYPA